MKIGTNCSYCENRAPARDNLATGDLDGLHQQTYHIRKAMRELSRNRNRRDHRTLCRHRGLQTRNPHVAGAPRPLLQLATWKADHVYFDDRRHRKEAHPAPTAPRKEQDHRRCHTIAIATNRRAPTWNTSSRKSSRGMTRRISLTSSADSANHKGRSVKPSCWTARTSDRWPQRTTSPGSASERSCDHRCDRSLKTLTSFLVDGGDRPRRWLGVDRGDEGDEGVGTTEDRLAARPRGKESFFCRDFLFEGGKISTWRKTENE